MKDELKPCPFCGGEVSIIEVTERPDSFVEEAFIQCEECGFSVHHKWLSVETLIKYWNKRAERTCSAERIPYIPGGYEGYWCSVCHCVDLESDEPNYCPNCGAKVVM